MRLRLIIFITVIVISFVLRIYRVDSTPHELNIDEVAIGYNAYSILTTGKDEYGNFMPISFRSFGDYKLPLYIYLTSISEGIFGETGFSVRLPSVVAGTLTVLVLMLFIHLLTASSRLSLLSGIFLAISPWHLQFSRAGFEANLALFWLLLGTYFIILSFVQGKRTFIPGLLSLLLSMYSYHSERVLVLFILVVLFLNYRNELRLVIRKTKKWELLMLFIITIPLIIYSFSPDGWARARGESFVNEYVSGQNISKPFWAIGQFITNYISYYSLDFHFFTGDTIGRHSVREIGMSYIWQMPLVFLGIYKIIINRKYKHDLMFFWLLISPLAASLASPNPHSLRALPLVVPIVYFTSLGMISVLKQTQKYKFLIIPVFCIVVTYFTIHYLHIYYVHYPERTSPDWSGGIKETVEYAKEHEDNYDKIVFSDTIRLVNMYIFFYAHIPPKVVMSLPDDNRFPGKYSSHIEPYLPDVNSHVLYIAEPHIKWNGKKVAIITNKGGDEVYYIWEN